MKKKFQSPKTMAGQSRLTFKTGNEGCVRYPT